MPRRRSTFRSLGHVIAGLCLAAALFAPAIAHAQACCAGGSVVTPARLELHERALIGVQLRASGVLGHYTPEGRFVPEGHGASEADFEEDLLGAVRFVPRGQVALQLPFAETYRHEVGAQGVGGGIGDLNLSVRYDFLQAGEARYLPGIALLAGVTAPTGRPPEAATPPLNVDATGIGAWQANLALALEELWGDWLVNATAIVAKRTPRGGETLGAQVTLLVAGAYTFENDLALAVSLSYAFEGSAARGTLFPEFGGGQRVDASSKRLTAVTVSGLWPIGDTWRVLGNLFVDPPLDVLGSNQPASAGGGVTVIRSWL